MHWIKLSYLLNALTHVSSQDPVMPHAVSTAAEQAESFRGGLPLRSALQVKVYVLENWPANGASAALAHLRPFLHVAGFLAGYS
jgi:hypothetical protein